MKSPDRQAWADAYASQGRSDWRVYKRLSEQGDIPLCHSLHYLQMASEKIAKAYRWRDTAASEHSLSHEHVAFSKFIGSFLKSPAIREDYSGRAAQLQSVASLCRKIAREVEKLAPAVDRATSPENAEYPWADGASVVVPSEYSYPALSLLKEAGGRTFLKFLTRAFEEYETLRIS